MAYSKIQSVIFARDKFTKAQAEAWLRRHKFRYDDYDKKLNYWRFRQIEPSSLKRAGYTAFRLKQIADGIKYVLAFKK